MPCINREEVWLRAWLVAAQREKADTSTGYADLCLRDFDKRFGAAKSKDQPK